MLLRNLFFAAATAHAFVLPPAPRTTRLQMMPPKPGDMTPESMRQAADALKTLKPDQIQQMLKEVEDMSPEERERLKGMGINPDMLKMSMKVMHGVEICPPRHRRTLVAFHAGHEGQPQRHQDGARADGQDVARADEAGQ